MNILGIDYGKKRIGLAWVQMGLDVVLPFGTVNNEQRTTNKLAILVRDEKINKIVVGLPVGLDGKENENTKRVRAFAEELENEVDIPIEFEDERFSSRQADRMGGDPPNRRAGASRDEKAAMLILQGYLDKQ